MRKKIVVTGGGGYIGRHTVTALCDAGAEVITVNHSEHWTDPRATVSNVDIFSGSPDIYQEMGCPDACLHMAWKDGFVHNSDAHMMNLSKHYQFIRDMLDGGLKQIAVMGTMHEVGYHEGAIDENTPCNPISLYGIAKDALRRSVIALTQNRKDVTMQWLRAYYIYGDDLRSNSIFAKLAQAAERGDKIFPFTTGKNKFDFIEVDELAYQITACVMQTEVDGIINCCTGKPVSLAERVEDFIKEHGYDIQLQYGVFPERAYESPAVWGDSSKIQDIMKKIKNK